MFPPRLVIIPFLVMLSCLPVIAKEHSDKPWQKPKDVQLNSLDADGYTLARLTDKDGEFEVVRVLQQGKTIREFGGEDFLRFTICTKGAPLDDVASDFFEIKTDKFDFDGDGHDEALVLYWSGGAHCCSGVFVCSTFGGFKVLGEVKFEDGSGVLCDLDKDGRPEIETQDWTFAYWNECFALSPSPRVVVGCRNTRMVALPELMRKPAVDVESAYDPPLTPWGWAPLLDLIYTGNGNEAWKFLDEVWPDKTTPRGKFRIWKTKRSFRSDFMKQLKKSPYWEEIKAMNGW